MLDVDTIEMTLSLWVLCTSRYYHYKNYFGLLHAEEVPTMSTDLALNME